MTTLRSQVIGARTPPPAPPARIPGATWQPGITPQAWRFKVLLDGEPVVSALAAREGYDGWVLITAEPVLCDTKPCERAPLGREYRVPLDLQTGERRTVTRRGVVVLVRIGGRF